MSGIWWLGLMILFIIIEIVTLGLYTIWFAGGALAAFFTSIADLPIPGQLGVFVVVSAALFILVRPSVVRKFNKNREKTNVDSIIGECAVVSKQIRNVDGEGQVMLKGMEWTARTTDDNVTLEQGTKVIVRAVEGVKLIVEKE